MKLFKRSAPAPANPLAERKPDGLRRAMDEWNREVELLSRDQKTLGKQIDRLSELVMPLRESR